ncbi:hypothetical protein KKG83_06030 [Candidatus Micrarchaeota archaeon]|nr:hypothetical protein [Candidatus Micrarchaeota archaeon]
MPVVKRAPVPVARKPPKLPKPPGFFRRASRVLFRGGLTKRTMRAAQEYANKNPGKKVRWNKRGSDYAISVRRDASGKVIGYWLPGAPTYKAGGFGSGYESAKYWDIHGKRIKLKK